MGIAPGTVVAISAADLGTLYAHFPQAGYIVQEPVKEPTPVAG
jgi:hypothetical protein